MMPAGTVRRTPWWWRPSRDRITRAADAVRGTVAVFALVAGVRGQVAAMPLWVLSALVLHLAGVWPTRRRRRLPAAFAAGVSFGDIWELLKWGGHVFVDPADQAASCQLTLAPARPEPPR